MAEAPPGEYGAHAEGADVSGRKLFVGGLSWETSEDALTEVFGAYGELESVQIMREKSSGRPRGFGFLVFKHADAAAAALAASPLEVDGRPIEPKLAVPKEDPASARGARDSSASVESDNGESSRRGSVSAASTASNDTDSPQHAYNQLAAAATTAETEAWMKTRKVFVGGVSSHTTNEEFREYFSRFGELEDAVVMFDPVTGRARGFGFVTYATEEGLNTLFASGVMHDIGDRTVEIKRAVPKESMAPGSLRARGSRGVGGRGAQGGTVLQGGATRPLGGKTMQQYNELMDGAAWRTPFQPHMGLIPGGYGMGGLPPPGMPMGAGPPPDMYYGPMSPPYMGYMPQPPQFVDPNAMAMPGAYEMQGSPPMWPMAPPILPHGYPPMPDFALPPSYHGMPMTSAPPSGSSPPMHAEMHYHPAMAPPQAYSVPQPYNFGPDTPPNNAVPADNYRAAPAMSDSSSSPAPSEAAVNDITAGMKAMANISPSATPDKGTPNELPPEAAPPQDGSHSGG